MPFRRITLLLPERFAKVKTDVWPFQGQKPVKHFFNELQPDCQTWVALESLTYTLSRIF
jgi:hypothetical protein